MKVSTYKKNPEYKVLEVGAATGYTSCLVAKEYGCSVTSADISEVLVNKARHRADALGLHNIEFKVADAMNLDFQKATFDSVFGIAITAVLPDKRKALREYVRVTKPGGIIGGLELFIRDDAAPEVEETLNSALGKVMGPGTRVMKLDEWIKLVNDTGLGDIHIDEFYVNVFENPGVRLRTIMTYLKLVYYLVSDRWFRSLFSEILELRNSVSVTRGNMFNNVGYLIFTGIKQYPT